MARYTGGGGKAKMAAIRAAENEKRRLQWRESEEGQAEIAERRSHRKEVRKSARGGP